MCITRQHVLVLEHRRGHRVTLGIIYLHNGLRCLAQELCVVELMSTILPSVQYKTTIAEGKFAVSLTSRDTIGQHATHRELTLIGHDALTEVHHPSAFCYDTTTPFGIRPDALTCAFRLHQRFQMFFGIPTRQIKQRAILGNGCVFFWIKEYNPSQTVNRLLIQKRKRLRIPCYHNLSSLSHSTFSSNNCTNLSWLASVEKSNPK